MSKTKRCECAENWKHQLSSRTRSCTSWIRCTRISKRKSDIVDIVGFVALHVPLVVLLMLLTVNLDVNLSKYSHDMDVPSYYAWALPASGRIQRHNYHGRLPSVTSLESGNKYRYTSNNRIFHHLRSSTNGHEKSNSLSLRRENSISSNPFEASPSTTSTLHFEMSSVTINRARRNNTKNRNKRKLCQSLQMNDDRHNNYNHSSTRSGQNSNIKEELQYEDCENETTKSSSTITTTNNTTSEHTLHTRTHERRHADQETYLQKKSLFKTYKYHQNHRKTRAPSWLENATNDILDLSRIPLGQLTSDDIESITGLMANWAKKNKKHKITQQQSQSSAMQVETLLKRVVDDHNYGNNSVKVTTRMYTMAIDAWAKTGGKKAAERAHMIHSNMVDMFSCTGDDDIRPSTISYNAVLNAWSKSGCKDACYKAENILEEMLENYYNTKEFSSSPLPSYVDRDPNGEEQLSINDKCIDNSNKTKQIVKPDVVSFTSVIDTWAKSGKVDAAAKAMTLLKRMEKLHNEKGEIGMKPNVYTYSACINAFAKSEDPNAPIQAEALLEDMKRAYLAGDMDVKPNVVNYNSVINAWGRCKTKGSAARAAEILKVMKGDKVEADTISYALVVSAWAHSSEDGATRKAEIVLEDMEKWARAKNMAIDQAFDDEMRGHQNENKDDARYRDHLNHIDSIKKNKTPSSLPTIRIHLDVDIYNTVLIALSKRQEVDAPDRALAIIRKMKKLADEGLGVRPNAKSWNSVLNTLSRSNDTYAAQRCEEVLSEMHKDGIVPDVFSYAALLHAYQKNTFPESAQKADDIVRQMEQHYFDGIISSGPDVYHYTIVCACWARSGERVAAERCWEILQHMEQQVKEGRIKCRPNVRTYNAVIDAYSRAHCVDEAEALLHNMIVEYERGDYRVKPDGFTFNAVINAWTRSRRKDSGEGAERILKLLLDFHEDGNPDVKPDSRSFSHIIDYYSRCNEPDAGEKAERLLNGMTEMFKKGRREVAPNMFCFNSVIQAYSRSNDHYAGIHAERVLRLLEDLHCNFEAHHLKPNTFIMNAVLYTWSRSANSMAEKRVEEILYHMEEQYRIGKYQMQPNTRSYGLVLTTWAKSLNPDKAKTAYTVLRRMDEASKDNEHVTKNVHCYNAVINAAAFTDGGIEYQRRAFQIATSTLDELIACKEIAPTSASFGTYMKACGKLSSLPRNLVDRKLEWAFSECKELGLVNDFVLTQMKYSCQTNQYQKMFRKLLSQKTIHERVGMAEAPFWWRRNVAEKIIDAQSYDLL